MSDFSEEDIDEWQIGSRLDEADPIWGTTANVYSSPLVGHVVSSNRGGSYAIAEQLIISARVQPAQKALISTWVTDQNRAGESIAILSRDRLTAVLKHRPLSYTAKVERFFSYLVDRGYRLGDFVVPGSPVETIETLAEKETITRWIEATGENEFWGFLQAMASGKLLAEKTGVGRSRPRGFYGWRSYLRLVVLPIRPLSRCGSMPTWIRCSRVGLLPVWPGPATEQCV